MSRATEPTARLSAAITLGLVLVAVSPSAPAQDAKTSPADAAKALQKQFRAERQQAVDSGAARKFSPQMVQRADDLAKQADAALDAGQAEDTARFYRDARWLL